MISNGDNNQDPVSTYSHLTLHGSLSEEDECFISHSRHQISQILKGEDPRKLCIVGPCSIHRLDSGIEYAQRLAELSYQVKDTLFIVMRAYLEKPRTLDGWKGFIFDPDLDGSHDTLKGIPLALEFLKDITKLKLPIAYEFVDPLTKPLVEKYISWGCIGARTCQSPIHRQLASQLTFPVAFKNTTCGNILTAIQGAKFSSTRQRFLEIRIDGSLSVKESPGNPLPHIVLRGGASGPNYTQDHIDQAHMLLNLHKVQESIIIDCSHDNSSYSTQRQLEVARESLSTMHSQPAVKGLMLESFIMPGKQDEYKNSDRHNEARINASLIDPCLGWEETVELLTHAHKILQSQRLDSNRNL